VRLLPAIGAYGLFVAVATGQLIYRNSPDWTSADTQYSTGAALVDLDGDAWLDLVVSNGNDMNRERVVVYYNQGDGTFPLTPDWQSSDLAYNGHLAVADVNGDGWPDVAVALLLNEGGPAAKLYLNNGGVLSSWPDWTSTEAARAFGVAFGDVNNDGRPDLAVVTGWPYNPGYEAKSTVHVNVNGQLENTASWQSDDLNEYMGGHWTDADNDGWLDLLAVAADTHTWVYRNLGGTLETTASWHTTDNIDQYAIMGTTGDVDGDGWRELFTTDNTQLSGSGYFRQYAGLAGGYFTQTPTWQYYEGYGSAIALADVDADGDLDLATGAWWDYTRLFLNVGGQFGAGSNWQSTGTSVVEKIVFGDIDHSALRPGLETFVPAADQHLFYLSRQPIDRIWQVRADGVELDPDEYTVGHEHGWVTVAEAPAVELEVDYLFSRGLDMAVSNWDSDKGNYVYRNRLRLNGNCDGDGDGDVDLDDYPYLYDCLTGPTVTLDPYACGAFDTDSDDDVDLVDLAAFLLRFTG
jgi:hypothetical protein